MLKTLARHTINFLHRDIVVSKSTERNDVILTANNSLIENNVINLITILMKQITLY